MNRKNSVLIILFILTITIIISCSKDNSIDNNPQPVNYSGIFGIGYPPMGSQEGIDFSAEVFTEVLGVNNVRFDVHWSLIQPNNSSEFDWSSFEKGINFVKENGLNLFLTVHAKSPDWACEGAENENSCVFSNFPAFESFITELLLLYGDEIEYIQYGNEMISEDFWAGTIQEFTTIQNVFYNIIKELRPTIPVVLGGISTGTLRRFAACQYDKNIAIPVSGGILLEGNEVDSLCGEAWVQDGNTELNYLLNNASYDLIDLHLYDDPEYWPLMVEAIQEAEPGIELVVSEFGGPFVGCQGTIDNCFLGPTENDHFGVPYSENYHAERLRHYMKTIKTLPIKKALHFTLVDIDDPSRRHAKSALYKRSGSSVVPKQPLIDVFIDEK